MPYLYTLRSGNLLFWLLLTLFLLLLYNLGGWGVIETSEARYAEISREMWQSGDWLHPRLLGIQHYHKPPVTYMISAVGMGLFDTEAFGARFFLQVSLVIQVWLVYLIGKQIFAENKYALAAAVIYVTIPAVLISVRNLTTDSFLTTFELAAIWAWLKYKNDSGTGWLYLFYLLLAMALLTKGPVGLIFPVLVVAGYKSAAQKSWHHLPGLLLFLVIGTSWYIYLMLQDSQFVDYFLFKHTVQRYANPETFGRSKPWWFYLVLTPALSLPWAVILLLYIRKLKKLHARRKRLFILWLLVPLVFFSVSGSKLILYILPLFAGQALLTAWLLFQLSPQDLKRTLHWSLTYFLVLSVALLLGPLLPLGVTFPWWTLLFPVTMLAAILFIWIKQRNYLQNILLSALIFTFLLIPYATHLLGNNPSLFNNSRPVADIIIKRQLQNRPILVYDRLLPSLAFELNRKIVSIHDGNSSLERETQFERDEKWKDVLLQLNRPEDTRKLQKLLQQNPVLVVKHGLPEEREWLRSGLHHRVQTGKWLVYY